MRFIVDENAGPSIARWLENQGVLLRLRDERLAIKRATLERLLSEYADRLPNQFVVVSERRVRFARQ